MSIDAGGFAMSERRDLTEEKAKRIIEIIEEHQAELDLAFVSDASWTIAGYKCGHLTIRAWFALIAARSRLIFDHANYRLSDIAALIFLLSGTKDDQHTICEKVYAEEKADRTGAMIEAVDQVIAHAFGQAPRSAGGGGTAGGAQVPCTSLAASIMDQLASQYGWTPQVILDLPVAQFWQLQREILIRNRGKEGRAMIMTEAERQVLDILDGVTVPGRK